MGWSQRVFSSMITEVGWDEQQGLVVTFKSNGKTWAYPAVDEGTAHLLANAPSVGGMFHSEIKGAYEGGPVD